tara:strand:+ start:1129 stop:1662 length:534 start_codon:yes stop_codon:yes gene_type:complete
MNILQDYEKNHLKQLSSEKSFPKFNAGDTLKVHLKVKEGEKERIQIFEGVCIGKKNSGLNSSFTIRKISYGEGIERVLPLYSPQINKIELVKSGDVRRSKLYYLRKRSGKSARISEKNTFGGHPTQEQTESSSQEKVEKTVEMKSDKGNKNQKKDIKLKDAGDDEKKIEENSNNENK